MKKHTATHTYTAYAAANDMTFIMQGVIDADTLEPISDKCIGWVYGQPSIGEVLNMPYYSLDAIYIDDVLSEEEEQALDEQHKWLWHVVEVYLNMHYSDADSRLDRLYDDDDFCNALSRCETEPDIENLLDNQE